MKMKLTEDQREFLSYGDDCDEENGMKIVSSGEWIDGGKWANKTTVFSFDEKFWAWRQTRAGSYFAEYYYENAEEAVEVIPREVMTTVWDEVK